MRENWQRRRLQGFDWPYSPWKNGRHEEEGVGVGGGDYVEQ
jgi:hypothetical protein